MNHEKVELHYLYGFMENALLLRWQLGTVRGKRNLVSYNISTIDGKLCFALLVRGNFAARRFRVCLRVLGLFVSFLFFWQVLALSDLNDISSSKLDVWR